MPQLSNVRLYRFGVYEIDVRSGELRKNGAKLRIQEQPFQVLSMLLERPGEVVLREELRQRLWPADTFVDFDHSLNTAVNKLRDLLGDSAASPRFIETLAKRGYRFIAPVQTVEAAPADQISAASLATNNSPAGAPPTAAECAVAVARAESRAAGPELPRIDRKLGRGLLALIQIMYLSFYIIALARWHDVGRVAEGAVGGWDWLVLVVVIISAVVGIPARLYLLTAVLFDFSRLGENFRRIFPPLFLLDELWALAPFLAIEDIGFGLAFAATAALLYVPFSQRTLVRMTYPVPSARGSSD